MKTISEKYRELCQYHHKNAKMEWGVSGGKWLNAVKQLAEKTDSNTILDYGAGKEVLSDKLRDAGYNVAAYDPAIKHINQKPEGQFDIVVCTDVLEHIEEKYIDNVLNEMQSYMKKAGFFTICLKIAKRHWLKDGRNAHILLKSRDWWMEKLSERWNATELEGRGWHSREMVVKVEI